MRPSASIKKPGILQKENLRNSVKHANLDPAIVHCEHALNMLFAALCILVPKQTPKLEATDGGPEVCWQPRDNCQPYTTLPQRKTRPCMSMPLTLLDHHYLANVKGKGDKYAETDRHGP